MSEWDKSLCVTANIAALHLSANASAEEHEIDTKLPGQPEDSDSVTTEDSSTVVGDYLTPLPHSFRVIRSIRATGTQAEWLCLPRKLPPIATDEDIYSNSEAESCKLSIRHDSVQAPANGDATYEELRAQLVVVKMHDPTKVLRNECNALDVLHYRSESEAFIGSWVLSEMYYPAPASSHICLRPIFGKTLDAFGQACLRSARIPTYFAWHIAASLMDALTFVHEAGIAHGSLSGANVVLRCQTRRHKAQFRDYPDVVLTEFGAASEGGDGKTEDVECLVKTLYYSGILQWNDAAERVHSADEAAQQSDPLLRLAQALYEILDTGSAVTLEGFKRDWGQIAVFERHKGPENCPDWIKQTAYDGLVTDTELEQAARPPLKLKLGKHTNRFREWAREHRTPVALRKRTTRSNIPDLLVIKFTDPAVRSRFIATIGSTG